MVSVRLILTGLMLAILPAVAPGTEPAPAARSELVVADFNSGRKPNNLGGDLGSWIVDPTDPMQGTIVDFDRANRFGSDGFALRLIYSVASGKPAFGGLWMQLGGLDASRFDHLILRVKGDSALGFTHRFKVELKDSVGQASRFEISGVSAEWREIVIPLSHFVGIANLRSLKELTVVIEDKSASARQGVLYFDDIRFVSQD